MTEEIATSDLVKRRSKLFLRALKTPGHNLDAELPQRTVALAFNRLFAGHSYDLLCANITTYYDLFRKAKAMSHGQR